MNTGNSRTDSWQGSGYNQMASWSSGFQLLGMLQSRAEVTALHAMHPSTVDGLALFAVEGDAKGVLGFFGPDGDVAATHDTGKSMRASTTLSNLTTSALCTTGNACKTTCGSGRCNGE